MTKTQARIVIMSPIMITRMQSSEHLRRCQKCERDFKEKKQKIVTKKTGYKTKWYHKKCAEQVNLI